MELLTSDDTGEPTRHAFSSCMRSQARFSARFPVALVRIYSDKIYFVLGGGGLLPDRLYNLELPSTERTGDGNRVRCTAVDLLSRLGGEQNADTPLPHRLLRTGVA